VHGRLFPIDPDWCEWRQEPPLSGTVLVRVAAGAGGRLVLTGLRIDGAPTAELLRLIPVGRIEAAANAQLAIVGDAVVPATPAMRPRHRRRAPSPDGRGWETSDPGRAAVRPAGIRVRAAVGPVPPSTGGRGRPDSFYREIAYAYLDLAQVSTRPVAELAEASGVPTTTAHRWIKEARRRHFLPPGHPGKAG
jgi:hypothetical protein